MIRQTSILAYESMVVSGKAESQRQTILDCIINNPDGLTREEVRDLLGIMYTSVCARIKELINSNKLIEKGTRINKSGTRARILYSQEVIIR